MRQTHRNRNNLPKMFEVAKEVKEVKPNPTQRLAKAKQKQQDPYKVVIVHPQEWNTQCREPNQKVGKIRCIYT